MQLGLDGPFLLVARLRIAGAHVKKARQRGTPRCAVARGGRRRRRAAAIDGTPRAAFAVAAAACAVLHERRARRNRTTEAVAPDSASALAAHRPRRVPRGFALRPADRRPDGISIHPRPRVPHFARAAAALWHGDRRLAELARPRARAGAAVRVFENPFGPVPLGVSRRPSGRALKDAALARLFPRAAAPLHRAAPLHLGHGDPHVHRRARPRLGAAVFRHRDLHDVHGDGQPLVCRDCARRLRAGRRRQLCGVRPRARAL